MPDIPLAFASFRIALDIVKGMKSLTDSYAIKEKTAELLDAIIAAQSDAIALQSQYQQVLAENDSLSKQLVEMQKWDEDEEKYQLKRIGGSFVVVPTSQSDSPDPQYYLCANCWQKKGKSILHISPVFNSPRWFCPSCKTTFQL